ncbi:hypothetical protein DBR37_01710 [Herminiimonas sp. KBW02]|uniref:Rap1a/Tai family immunity protein n=1 Tax=Herminiimonas sp. KBW02 TaxID=2153363 RepID=UPI000F5B1AC8|nr:Rap1a/Tai family immunity protein [Herminiimonas sp. KBW02]RQO38635.1 hypothetical protein DBR37_01710 [Herminiimonas sp. KBW02]
MHKKIVAAAALTLAASSAMSMDGNDLYKMCATSEKDPTRGICIGYVRGFIEGLQGQAWMTKTDMVFCAPKNMQFGQAVDIFTNYLRDRPEDRHSDAGILLVASMARAYPCPGNRKPQ